MRKKAIKNLEIMTQATNYNKWIFNRISPYLGKRILEIGCGIGNITSLLLKNERVELVVGVDNSSECLDIINTKLNKYKRFKGFWGDISSEEIFSLEKHNFDTIVCINVLEHVKNDLKALENMALFNNCTLILLVPALQSLYGTIDAVDGHFRRYEKESLEEKLTQAGWEIHKRFYLNLLGIPIWFLHGKILRKALHPSRQVSFLDKFLFLEVLLEKAVNLPVGLSLLCTCTKKQ
jgi:SAM-dependent methyltransferase